VPSRASHPRSLRPGRHFSCPAAAELQLDRHSWLEPADDEPFAEPLHHQRMHERDAAPRRDKLSERWQQVRHQHDIVENPLLRGHCGNALPCADMTIMV
jgi:hypothetical protein